MIESERLIFKEMTENDFDTIAKIMRDEGVQKIWEHYFSDDDVREWIEKHKSNYRNYGIGHLLAIDKLLQDVVGQIGIIKENINGEIVWGIGYILMSEHCGKGYATEGAKAMIDYAFNTLNASKIVCVIRPMNKSSISVAKRLGMIETSSFVKEYRGKEMPHLVFELNNTNAITPLY
jgi:[ribosomal protein S5]-alanine N-acetyltransferase